MSNGFNFPITLHDGIKGPDGFNGGQLTVFRDPSRFKVLVAGRRFGKTWLALNFLITESLKGTNFRVWYVAPWYRQAKDVAWKLLKDLVPRDLVLKWNESELTCTLINNSIISLKGADNPESLLGVGLNAVVLDEFASMRSEVWDEIIRPMLSDTMGRVLFIGTPKGKNKFYELYIKGQTGEEGYKSWLFTTAESPYIPADEVASAKAQMTTKKFRQEYLASFEDFTGLVYPEFDEKVHVIEPTHIVSSFKRLGSIDPAIVGVTCVLKAAVDEEGDLLIYDEYYEKDKRVSEICNAVADSSMIWFIDPAARKQKLIKEGQTYSLFDEYVQNGISPILAENDVDAGINRVGEFFKHRKIRIFNTCKNLIKELQQYRWAESRESIRGEGRARPFKKFDHGCDSLRYMVMGRVTGEKMIMQEHINPDSAWGRYLKTREDPNKPGKYGRPKRKK